MLSRNIVSNTTGFGVQVAVTFFLTPFVLHTIGDTRYGIWSLVAGITGYYGLLDVGLRSGITQYLARYLSLGDFDKMNRIASTGFVALACSSVVIFLVSFVLGQWAVFIFHVPPEIEQEVVWCIWIVGGSVAMQFMFFPFSAVFTATERFDLANVIGILSRLLYGGGAYLCVKAGYGLLGLSLVTAASNLLDYGLRWRLAYRILPQLRVSPRLANWGSCWEFMQFGVWNFLIDGGVRLISYTHSIIIGLFMPVAAIAHFALASNLRNYFSQFFAPISHVFFPAATHLDAQGDLPGLRRMYLGGSRLMFIVAIGSGTISAFLAKDFFRLWVGSSYVESESYPSVSLLFSLLLGATICTAGQRIGYQVLLGTRRVRVLATLFAVEGVLNIILSLALIRPYGLLGLAAATLIPAVIIQGIFYPVVLATVLDIRWDEYLRNVLLRPVMFGLFLAGAMMGFRLVTPAASWGIFFLYGAFATMIAFALVLAIGLTKKERNALFILPLTRCLCLLKSCSLFARPSAVPAETATEASHGG